MTGSALVVLAALTGTVALAGAVTVVRRPVARRLAVRSARRRPAETVLVTVGALLGTAIITGSLVVGDTLDASIRAGAFTQLGPVDETVTSPGVDALPRLRDALADIEDHPAVDGVAFGVRAPATTATGLDGDDPAVQPDALLLELAFEEARELGGQPSATGLDGVPTPAPGQVAISTDLAESLEVDVGEPVTVAAYGTSRGFEVASVLPRVGLAGYTTGLGSRSHNVFLPPGTLRQWTTDAPDLQQAQPPVALAFVSNQGDVLSGAERTRPVVDLLQQRLATVPEADVTATKQDLLDRAEETGAGLTEIFLGVGAFAVLAGILLLVNVFVMLAQERRSELGIMRAVGMRRGELVRAFSLEGLIYATAAAVAGALAGIGVGAAIVQLAKGIAFSGGPAGFGIDLRFTADAGSIIGGLLVGLLLSVATIVATSVRASRLNVIRAIRELPDPPRQGRRTTGIVVGSLGTLAGATITLAGLVGDAGAATLVGPAVLAAGLVALVGPLAGRRRVVTVLGLLVVAWGTSAPTLQPATFRNADVVVFVVQGLVITGAAVVVLGHNQATVGRSIRRAVGGSASLTARLGLAYPLARPFRTTMTLAMYALVVFTLVLISLLAQVFGGQVDAFADAEGGGYDLLVTSAASNPLPSDAVDGLDGVEVVAPLHHAPFNIEFRASGEEGFRRWFASGYDRRLLHDEPPALDQWLPRFADERDAWEHVLDEPSAMIVGSQFLQEGGEPQPIEAGDIIEVRDPVTGTTARREVAATMEAGLAFSGAFMSREGLESILGPAVAANRLYVALSPDADPGQIAATLEGQHLEHGVEARPFESVVADRQQQNRRFLSILQGYLLLGLLVGTAGLGVVMTRAVRERHQEIGVLRSIGLQAGTVARSFVLEASFVALQGTAVGATLGAITAYQLVTGAGALGDLEVSFQIPWTEVAVLLGVTMLASIAATGLPARRAARIPPAAALRRAE